MEQLCITIKVQDFLLQVVGIGTEHLTEGHGNGILELRAPHLDVFLVFFCLVAEGADESAEAGHEGLVHANQRQADGRWVDIVGGLTAVAVVVRRTIHEFPTLMPHDFQRSVGDYLIGIHVDRSSCAALHHIDGEVFVHLSLDKLLASLLNGC